MMTILYLKASQHFNLSPYLFLQNFNIPILQIRQIPLGLLHSLQLRHFLVLCKLLLVLCKSSEMVLVLVV
jgi:hypothetical protein